MQKQKTITPAKDKIEKVYVDLLGPHNPLSFSGSIFALILICKKSQKTWVLFFWLKDKFVNALQIWFPKIENKSKYLLKTLCVNEKREFISIKLKVFRKNKEIALKYVAPYMHKENSFAKKK